MKTLLLIFISLTFAASSHAQLDDTVYIKKNAIRIAVRTEVNDRVYNALRNYRIILVGEAHGTVEPAEFAEGIVQTFLKHNKEVIVGLEIPSNEMDGFITGRSKDSLATSRFFNKERIWGIKGDGKASEAWAKLLISMGNTEVHFAFFDITHKQCDKADCNRDSLMFENVNESLKQYPNAVFIGLCGNAHNMLHPNHMQIPMAWYLQNAPNTCLKDTTLLLCLNLIFNTGAMNCNMGDGLKVFEYKYGVAGNPGKAVNYNNYLLLGYDNYYSGLLYSKTIHASLLWLK